MARIYQGYAVLVATFICRFVGMGLFYSGGLFIIPISVTFGVGSGLAALFVSIYSAVSFVASLLSGYLQDKLVTRGFSIRPVFSLGAALVFVAMIAASFCTSFILFLFCAIFMGIGIGFTCFSAPAVVSLWFEKKRDRNLLLAMSGGGIGSFVYAQVIVVMMSKFHEGDEVCSTGVEDKSSCAEWRPTMRYLGACSSIILLVASYFMRNPSPEEVDEFEGNLEVETAESEMSREDVERPIRSESTSNRNHNFERSESMFMATGSYDSEQLSFKEVTQSKTSILLCLWALTMAIVLDGYFIFVPSYAEEIGLSKQQGGLAVSIAGLALLIGNVTLGFITDLLGNIKTFQLCMIGITVSVFIWPFCKTIGSLLVVSVGVGFCTVSISLYVSILADVYGNIAKNCFFSVVGFVQSFEAPGVLFGPVVIGMLIDKFGYYAGAYFCAGVFAISVAIVFALPSKESQLKKIFEKRKANGIYNAAHKLKRQGSTSSLATTSFRLMVPSEMPRIDEEDDEIDEEERIESSKNDQKTDSENLIASASSSAISPSNTMNTTISNNNSNNRGVSSSSVTTTKDETVS